MHKVNCILCLNIKGIHNLKTTIFCLDHCNVKNTIPFGEVFLCSIASGIHVYFKINWSKYEKN